MIDPSTLTERQRQFIFGFEKLPQARQNAVLRLLLRLRNNDAKAFRLLEMRAAGQISGADFWGRI